MAREFDPIDERLPLAIEELIVLNENVTARAVARRVGIAPTTITRNDSRMKLIMEGLENQRKLRTLIEKADKESKAKLVRKIAERDRRVAALERQVRILVASHKAMLLAIGEAGGTAAWCRFFSEYERIRDELRKLSAMPEAQIVAFHGGSNNG
jgi:hypothetical protein